VLVVPRGVALDFHAVPALAETGMLA
jgi:hypothetical protein